MRTLVRPCTNRTRRKQLTIKMHLPQQCFEELMEPFAEGEVDAALPSKGWNQPRAAVRLMRFSYVLNKVELSDNLFALNKF
eukprot:5486621-Pleurochrysis_carterae.AAC.1